MKCKFIIQHTKQHSLLSCGSFSHGDLGLKLERADEGLTEAISYYARLSSSKQMLSLFDSLIKIYSH